MRSAFRRTGPKITSTSSDTIDEVYDLRGLNLVSPDQIMPKGESPMALNARQYARDVADKRVAIKTRPGVGSFSSPVGQVADVQNVAAITGDLVFTPTNWLAQPFTTTTAGSLTELDLWIKRLDGASGPVVVEIWSNVAGAPGVKLGQSSINLSLLTLSYQYLPAYFIDAPSLAAITQYWVVAHTQLEGLGSYHLGQTTATGGLTSNTSGAIWTALGASFRFKTFLSTPSLIKGFTRRSPSDKNYRSIFAFGTNLYSVPDSPAVPVSISSTISASATKVRFDQINDLTYYADSFSPLKSNDGTIETVVAGITGNVNNVIAHKNRLFVLKNDNLRVEFSDLYNFTSWSSVNFFYVGNPKSPDPVAGWVRFQDNLVIFTRDTKYIVSGSDISSFTIKQAVGTKGAISQEVLGVDRNYVYFVATDGSVNRFNGISDELISDKIQPETSSFQNLDNVSLVIHNNQVRIYYSKSPNILIAYMLLYDVVYAQWFTDTGKPLMGAMSVKIGNTQTLLEFSSLIGQIYTGDTGTSDLGKAIDFKYWTPYKSYNSGASKKRVKRFRPVLRASQARYSMKVGRDFDFQNKPDLRDYPVNGAGALWGSGIKWGSGATYGSTSLVQNASAVSGRANYIQYRFEKNGVDTPIAIYGYIVLVKEGRPR